MDTERFDGLTRIMAAGISRRGLVAAVGLLAPGVAAKKKRKRKKKLKKNEYGCVNVGGKCRGKEANCCSGICQGKKPKKGKKDKSTCVAHNELDCATGADSCQGLVACAGGDGGCFQTTGRASFCGAFSTCIVCQTDTDCEAIAGPGAACIVCTDCPDTGNTGCAVP